MIFRPLGKSPRLAGDNGSTRKDNGGGRDRRQGWWGGWRVQHRARGRERPGCRWWWGWRRWRWGVRTTKAKGGKAIWLHCQHVQCPSGKWMRVMNEQEEIICSSVLISPRRARCTFHSCLSPKSAFLLLFSCLYTPHVITSYINMIYSNSLTLFPSPGNIQSIFMYSMLCLCSASSYMTLVLHCCSEEWVWFGFLHVVLRDVWTSNFPQSGIINQLVSNLFIDKWPHSWDAKVQERMIKKTIKCTVDMMSFTGAAFWLSEQLEINTTLNLLYRPEYINTLMKVCGMGYG